MATAPAPASCWPVDTTHCEGYTSRPADVRAFAEALAGETMRSLVGYRLGACAVTMRPDARSGCLLPVGRMASSAWAAMGTRPYNGLVLPGGANAILGVVIDGATFDPADYRLDNGSLLVRIDGDTWPVTQDIAKPVTEPGTWGVIYKPGPPVDSLGARAAGSLACEFAKALSGEKCALPANARNVQRQGISFEVESGWFPGGRTGLQDVDLYVQRWNPLHLTAPASVWSPDVRRNSYHTPVGGGIVGSPGPQGVPGPPGPSGSGSAYTYTQATPAATWTIPHNLGRLPDVAVYEPDGSVVYPDVDVTDQIVVITFSSPAAGSAVLT